jgi:Lon protease-like protein
MSAEPEFDLSSFDGTARLFPLPNLVLFPHAVQPLHIFEPRYRQLMVDCLAADRLMAMALLQPGWEEDYHQRPAIHPVVCLGHVGAEQRLPDGRYNLLLHGFRRARVLEELKTDRLYRTARVQLLEDVAVDSKSRERLLRYGLGTQVENWYAGAGPAEAVEQLKQLLAGGLELGVLCDLFAFALPLDLAVKQQLLEEVDVGRRVDLLLRQLAAQRSQESSGDPMHRYPPDFSAN